MFQFVGKVLSTIRFFFISWLISILCTISNFVFWLSLASFDLWQNCVVKFCERTESSKWMFRISRNTLFLLHSHIRSLHIATMYMHVWIWRAYLIFFDKLWVTSYNFHYSYLLNLVYLFHIPLNDYSSLNVQISHCHHHQLFHFRHFLLCWCVKVLFRLRFVHMFPNLCYWVLRGIDGEKLQSIRHKLFNQHVHVNIRKDPHTYVCFYPEFHIHKMPVYQNVLSSYQCCIRQSLIFLPKHSRVNT